MGRPQHIRTKSKFLAREWSSKSRHDGFKNGAEALAASASSGEIGDALKELYTIWNNGSSADIGFLAEAYDLSRVARVGILECGSGLSTLVCAVGADVPIVSLDHDWFWSKVTASRVRGAGLSGADILYCPLRSFGEYEWYGVPASLTDMRFDVVICDGPPGQVLGGRYGLLPIMERSIRGSTVLLDDADRASEQRVVTDWCERYDAQASRCSVEGEKVFARIELP